MKKERPIIRKIIKKNHAAHHGGAWKIAYADFVTAMMAFFLIMWLISSISIDDRKGIANVFSTEISVIKSTPKSDGFLQENVVIQQQNAKDFDIEDNEDNEKIEKPNFQQKIEDRVLIDAEERLIRSLEANTALKAIVEQIAFRISEDGLDINIFDKENRSMFPPGSAGMYDFMRSIIKEVATVLKTSTNKIGISGHTDAIPYANTKDYSNWELSADRANAIRRELEAEGVSSDRIEYVRGRSSKELFDKKNPSAANNRRITITLLR